MKNNIIIYATAYPYTAGILTVIWIGSVMLLIIDRSLSLAVVMIGNVLMTLIIASIGFRK